MGVLQCPAVWSQAVWQGLLPLPLHLREVLANTVPFSTQDTRYEGWAWVRYTHTCTHAETLSALTHVHIDVTRHTVKGLKLWCLSTKSVQQTSAMIPMFLSLPLTIEHGDQGGGKAAPLPQHCRSPLPTPHPLGFWSQEILALFFSH